MLFRIPFLSLLLLIAACAAEPQLHARVTRFHTPEFAWKGKSFVMQPEKAQEESLEMQSYGRELEAALVRIGMKKVAAPPADLGVRYDFSIGTAKTTLVDNGIRGYGWDFGYRYGGFGGPHAGWGVAGPITPLPLDRRAIESFTLYPHAFSLQMIDLRRGDRPTRFEGKVVSDGAAPEMVTVSRCLIEAALQNLPGEDGEAVTFSQPAKNCVKDNSFALRAVGANAAPNPTLRAAPWAEKPNS